MRSALRTSVMGKSVIGTAVMVGLTTGVLAACGSGSSSPSGGGTPVQITAANIRFSTTDIKVPAGKVTFVMKNDDKVEHSLTIDNASVDKEVEGGKTGRATTTLGPGTYSFRCRYHPDAMKGTITVT